MDERYERIFKRDRETIRRYSEELVPAMKQTIAERKAEIEVLTTERDNALLRVEELEMRNAELALALHDIQEHS